MAKKSELQGGDAANDERVKVTSIGQLLEAETFEPFIRDNLLLGGFRTGAPVIGKNGEAVLLVSGGSRGQIGKSTWTQLTSLAIQRLGRAKPRIFELETEEKLKKRYRGEERVIHIPLPETAADPDEIRRNPALVTAAFEQAFSLQEEAADEGIDSIFDLRAGLEWSFAKFVMNRGEGELDVGLGRNVLYLANAVGDQEGIKGSYMATHLMRQAFPDMTVVGLMNNIHPNVSLPGVNHPVNLTFVKNLLKVDPVGASFVDKVLAQNALARLATKDMSFEDLAAMDLGRMQAEMGLSRVAAKMERAALLRLFALAEDVIGRVVARGEASDLKAA